MRILQSLFKRQVSTPASITPEERHEEMRRKCWINAAASVAGASNCISTRIAMTWADNVLKGFDQRFPAPVTNNSNNS